MSIILKKKKTGQVVPKSNPPTPGQILGNLGLGSVLGAALNKKEAMIDELIEEAIIRLIVEKLLLHSKRLVRSLDYFVAYQLVNGEKTIKALYLKKSAWLDFIRIDRSEMLATGAKPDEFLTYLKSRRCRKIKISREQLENII